ncbi:hypothetical protein JB92DRAFT_2837042 [Gautieria morchelliformis]|nr:hypothetical protein JB92DRAFT_2837042 [Gautieria morchelliformis]
MVQVPVARKSAGIKVVDVWDDNGIGIEVELGVIVTDDGDADGLAEDDDAVGAIAWLSGSWVHVTTPFPCVALSQVDSWLWTGYLDMWGLRRVSDVSNALNTWAARTADVSEVSLHRACAVFALLCAVCRMHASGLYNVAGCRLVMGQGSTLSKRVEAAQMCEIVTNSVSASESGWWRVTAESYSTSELWWLKMLESMHHKCIGSWDSRILERVKEAIRNGWRDGKQLLQGESNGGWEKIILGAMDVDRIRSKTL